MEYTTGKQCQVMGLPRIYKDRFGYITNGFFVDVGAHNGIAWSNTWGLAEIGWSGICFEPNNRTFLKLKDAYRNNGGNVVLVNAAIGDFEGTTDLFVAGSISTIQEDTANLYATLKSHNVMGIKNKLRQEVRINTLDNELKKWGAPTEFQVLSIDVEGSELKVLSGFDIDYWKPSLVIIEAHEHHKEKELAANAPAINEYMENHNYDKIYSDYINNVYTRN